MLPVTPSRQRLEGQAAWQLIFTLACCVKPKCSTIPIDATFTLFFSTRSPCCPPRCGVLCRMCRTTSTRDHADPPSGEPVAIDPGVARCPFSHPLPERKSEQFQYIPIFSNTHADSSPDPDARSRRPPRRYPARPTQSTWPGQPTRPDRRTPSAASPTRTCRPGPRREFACLARVTRGHRSRP